MSPPRRRVREADRQAVLDAAAVLQVRRTETATAVAAGRAVEAEIVESYPRGLDQVGLNPDVRWSELMSVRPSVTATQLRASLPTTRAWVAGGLRMTSVYDADGTSAEARLLLAGETLGTYLLSVAPVQMKIVDRHQVLLQGPLVDDRPTVMAVRSPACVDAAWRYWDAVLAAGFEVGESVAGPPQLSRRQRQVAALLATGAGDDAIAQSLGVSVRTVRSDIAAMLDVLGAQTRFAAGTRLQMWSTVSRT